MNRHQKNRDQKIKILKAIQAGKATISALIPDSVHYIIRPASKGPCITLVNGKQCTDKELLPAVDWGGTPSKIKVTRMSGSEFDEMIEGLIKSGAIKC